MNYIKPLIRIGPDQTLSEAIHEQEQKIQAQIELITKTSTPKYQSQWKSQYQTHKMNYLMRYCNFEHSQINDTLEYIINNPYADDHLFGQGKTKTHLLKFDWSRSLSRPAQIQLYKAILKDQNPLIVKFYYQREGLEWDQKLGQWIQGDSCEIGTCEFADLNQYINNYLKDYKKRLSGLRAIKTKLLKMKLQEFEAAYGQESEVDPELDEAS